MRCAWLLALAACGPTYVRSAPKPAWVEATAGFTPGTPTTPTIVQRYRATASRIISAARHDHAAYRLLAELTDTIGARLAGSPQLDKAIDWAARRLRDAGHDVRTEPVMVPHWVRGREEAALVEADGSERELHIIGLGGTVSTPFGGVTARVVVVTSWDDLEARAADVKGAIVLYNVPLPAWDTARGFSGYGEVAPYRSQGPSRAAKLGAVGVLMRSVTATSLSTPHTGAMRYADGVPKIAAAAITTEDAELLARRAAAGPTEVRLRIESQQLPDVPSANVIAELRGRELPDEVVLIGAHIDSWDVGQGAHDDGAGCVMMMQALTTLRTLGLQPRRTIRVVLFTNEENGLRGGRGYAKDHAAEIANTVLALEADSGGFAPVGFGVELADGADPTRSQLTRTRIGAIADLLRPLAPMRVIESHSGADISPLVEAGVPGVGLIVDSATYFDIHHTSADTLDKVDPDDLAAATAAVAVFAYIVADLPGRIDAP